MKSPLLAKLFTLTVVTSCTFLPLEAKSQSIHDLGKLNTNYKNESMTLALVSTTDFLANYPAGTVLCFSDRSVENKVEIVDFNQSFQVVDFVYLDGGYQSQKGSANYDYFVRNSYQCSY
jgi:fructose-bisphosphate aldolase class 1